MASPTVPDNTPRQPSRRNLPRRGEAAEDDNNNAQAASSRGRPTMTDDQPGDETPTHITITTYNVISARKERLLTALRAMADLNTDIAFLTETKLDSGRHTKQGFGYHVFATTAASPSQGGTALIWKAGSHHWTLEGMRAISANSISATLVSGKNRWLLLGTYLAPSIPPDDELDRLETEYHRHPHLPAILMGDLNADVTNLTSNRSITIATTLQHIGVADIFHKFPQKQKRNNTRHKRMTDGTHQRSRCDYTLVDPTVDVKSLRLVIPARFQSDHWAIKLQIRSANLRAHRRYLHNRSHLPHITPQADEHGPNLIFDQLMDNHTRTPPTTSRPRMHG